MRIASILRLFKSRAGSVTVETALVILPLILLAVMTTEEMVIQLYQQNLAYSVYAAARLIRTGQEATQEASLSSPETQLSNFINNICSTTVIPSCCVYSNTAAPTTCSGPSSRLEVIVSAGSPTSPPTAAAAPSGSIGSSSYAASASTACSLVLIQVWYGWPILAALNRNFLTNASIPNTYLMSFASLLQNEPAAGKSATPCTSIS